MRILFAAPGYKPAWRIGGPIESVGALAEGLVQRGHQVTVFTTDANLDRDLAVETDRAVDVNGVSVWYFRRQEPMKRLFPAIPYVSKTSGFLYSPRMRRALEEIVPGIDVVHTHLPFIYPTFAAARAAKRWRKPLLYHQRGVFDPARLKYRSLKKSIYLPLIELPVLRRAAMLIALTNYEVESYRRLGLDRPCRVIPNGVSSDTPAADPTLLRPFGISERDTVILFLGRIHPIKGADKLVEAFLKIAHSFKNAKLVLAGPDELGLQRSFAKRASTSGLGDRVVFPGMVDGKLKWSLLDRAEIFCLPSAAEGFSMAVLEALVSGTAVVLSPGCHFPEVAAAGAGVIAGTEPEVLADALAGLLRDPSRLAEMRRSARRFATTSYSWSRVTDDIIDAYREVVADNQASSR